MSPLERARKGGQKTAALHGSVHMEAIGRAGHYSTAERLFAGDTAAYMAFLRDQKRRYAEARKAAGL